MNNEIVGKLRFRDYLCYVLHKEKKVIILEVIITVIIVYLLLPKNTSLILGLFFYVFLKEMILLYISTEEAILIPRHFFSTLEEAEKWEVFINNHLLG